MTEHKIIVNRAPVLTLWAAVVAQRLGYDADEALTLGKAVAGLNAQSKGRSLGIYGPGKAEAEGRSPEAVAAEGQGAALQVPLMERLIPAVRTPQGIRAVNKGQPEDPASVERYLASKFGAHLAEVREAFAALAASYPPERLAEVAYSLYLGFRPEIPAGRAGWGAAGELDLAAVRRMGR